MGRKPGEKALRQYLDNKAFLEALDNWDRKERMPDVIGKYILDIIDNLGKSGRFNGYTWLDSMKGDALESCVKGIKNFDSSKSKNPFAYITMIAWHAFTQRIKKENKLVSAMNEYMNDANNILYATIDGNEYAYNNLNEKISLTNIIQYGHGKVYTKKDKKSNKVKKVGKLDEFL